MIAWYEWFTKLRHSSGIQEAAAILAQAAGETLDAQVCGVFLLNELKDELLYYASWSREYSAREHTGIAVKLSDLSDPISLMLHEGTAARMALQVGIKAPKSLQLLYGNEVVLDKNIAAYPLYAFRDTLLGAVLASGKKLFLQEDAQINILCDYCAMAVHSILQSRNYNDNLRQLQEDIVRIKKGQEGNREAISSRIVGQSLAAQTAREQVRQVACRDFPVLITGETGTGKEVVASAIHAASQRADAPFVKVNCAALPEQLLESELFGHKKGAFSGAESPNAGLFRSADKGTIFLDEIAEMPVSLQVKLLRVLQEHEVRPVGDVRSYPVNIRILSATNKNIQEAIANGALRADLFYRLSGVQIHLPPLRERIDDIPALSEHFVKLLCAHSGAKVLLSIDALSALSTLPYPGNIRELKSYISHAFTRLNGGFVITSEHFPFSSQVDHDSTANLQKLVAIYERSLIRSELIRRDGNIDHAAKALGMPRSTLRSKLKKTDRMHDSPEGVERMSKPEKRAGHGHHV